MAVHYTIQHDDGTTTIIPPPREDLLASLVAHERAFDRALLAAMAPEMRAAELARREERHRGHIAQRAAADAARRRSDAQRHALGYARTSPVRALVLSWRA